MIILTYGRNYMFEKHGRRTYIIVETAWSKELCMINDRTDGISSSDVPLCDWLGRIYI